MNNKIVIICGTILLIFVFGIIIFNNKNKNENSSSDSEIVSNVVYEVYNEESGLYELRYTDSDEVIDYYKTQEDMENIKEYYDENPDYIAQPPSSPNASAE